MEKLPTVSGTTNLVDILDRVLDKGLVVAGDIRISLANVELLTIRIRLLIFSVDKAEQIGLNWWKYDPHLTLQARSFRCNSPVRRFAAVRRLGPLLAGAGHNRIRRRNFSWLSNAY